MTFLGELAATNREAVAALDRPTLRDQFAMAALTGILSDSNNLSVKGRGASRRSGDDMVRAAYGLADTMLAERSRKP